jgi:hypothetical protein
VIVSGERHGPGEEILSRAYARWGNVARLIDLVVGTGYDPVTVVEVEAVPTRNGRGGKRPGAGRPVSPNPLQRVSLRLSAAHIARLKAIGGGNVSEGVRRLLDAQREP